MCIRDSINAEYMGYMKGLLIFFLVFFAVSCRTEENGGERAYDFLKGFLEGIEEKRSMEDLAKCLKDVDIIIDDIVKAFKLLLTFSFSKVVEGVKLLIASVKKFMNMLSPCSQNYTQLRKLWAEILDTDIFDIIHRIMYDPPAFIVLLEKAIKAITKGDYQAFGYNLGRVLFKLYLEDQQN
eukprot:TRINITY_DN3260_c0_g3_i2.p1 TRINITY_DN3260_c0_g3~~TRINITY_DN3260_c0_g3_i2.p1  ORF type:complete len:181 (+),score=48.81 TRINITY_DN3260_c0_g3_i2:67-609(+)